MGLEPRAAHRLDRRGHAPESREGPSYWAHSGAFLGAAVHNLQLGSDKNKGVPHKGETVGDRAFGRARCGCSGAWELLLEKCLSSGEGCLEGRRALDDGAPPHGILLAHGRGAEVASAARRGRAHGGSVLVRCTMEKEDEASIWQHRGGGPQSFPESGVPHTRCVRAHGPPSLPSRG